MAVSGANCAIVVAAIYFTLHSFGSKTRIVTSLSALVAYVLLVGPQPSVLRAALMAAAVMLAMSLGRRVNAISALALSVLVLLCLAPELAVNYGFALSVLATAGILILAPKLFAHLSNRFPNWIAMGLAVSAAAQLFCFPVLLGLQGGVPTYSLLANLICEPLVAPVTVLGLIATLLAWCQPLASGLFWLSSVFAWPITVTAKVLAGLPFAKLPWLIDGFGITLAVTVVVAIVVAINSGRLLTQNLAWLLAACIFACSAGVIWSQVVRVSIWPMRDWQVASCDVGQGDATVVRDQGAIAVIDVGRDEKKIDNCLSKLGILHIDLLVLTHFDADHVNGLAGAIRNRSIGEAMLTSFVDDRPGADFSRFLLTTHKIPIIKSEQGLSGDLAGAKWKVLSPSRTASEAEDSNDGSITMLWRFNNFQLITLADLGEKGQQRLAASLGVWWTDPKLPLVMKVSHHGSADQYPEFIEWLHPKLALISVGANNGYGHPTKRTLNTLNRAGATTLRTDLLGSIALRRQNGEFEVSYSGSS
jgi:competence protein ComEC